MKEWLILDLSQGKYKISLEHLVVPESKEAIKTPKDEGMSKGHRSQSERVSYDQNGTIGATKYKIVLNYNPKCK